MAYPKFFQTVKTWLDKKVDLADFKKLATVATSGSYNDLLNKPTSIKSAETATTATKLGTATVGGKTTPIYLVAGVATAGTALATVATSGSYSDLKNLPESLDNTELSTLCDEWIFKLTGDSSSVAVDTTTLEDLCDEWITKIS